MIDYPHAFSTSLTGIADYGVAAGYYTNPGAAGSLGFIYDHGKSTTVAFPNATNVYIYGIENAGLLYGSYSDTVLGAIVGFVATPVPAGQPIRISAICLHQKKDFHWEEKCSR